MNNDTPRTDALHAKCIEIEALCWMAGREYIVMRKLARTLERELAALRERLAEAERHVGLFTQRTGKSDVGQALAWIDTELTQLLGYRNNVSANNREWARQNQELRERAQQAEQRAERAEQDAERMEAIEKHGLKIVTDFVIDSLVAGRTFGSVRELFDAAIAARSAT